MLTTVTTSFENGASTSNNSVREQPDKQKLEKENEKKGEEEDVIIAFPLLLKDNQVIIKQPMESIPEVEEIESSIGYIGNNNNNIESPTMEYSIKNNLKIFPSNILIKKRKEIYRTEEIDTLVSTLPKEVIPPEWDKLVNEEIVEDPKMAHTYITEIPENITPIARGNKYSYIYESKLEEEDNNNNNNCKEEGKGEGKGEEINIINEENEIENKNKSTQKITKITKITTTRSVKQFPIEPGNLFFDLDGNPIFNSYNNEIISSSSSPSPSPVIGKVISEPSEDELLLPLNSSETIITEDSSVGINLINKSNSSSNEIFKQKYKKETPSKPGIPQINECFEKIIDGEGEIVPLTISLSWSSPEFDGTEGPLIGYRVEFRRSELDEWEPAHDDLLGENECKITNLDPEDNYQFRVVGANIAGFGLPSDACLPIKLKPESTQFSSKKEYPPSSPGRPEIINIESDRITIKWKELEENKELFKINYMVQYREINLNWINAIELPIKECQLTILNLRPNGQYEFRIISKNEETGKELIGPTSGFVRIRPPPPIKNEIISNKELLLLPGIPGKPQVIEFDQNWIKLNWECPLEYSNLAYLVEIREVGSNNWKQLLFDNSINYTTINNYYIVNNLSPNCQYEFRIWSISLINGLHSSLPSPISEPINLLLPQLNNLTLNNKKVPERPSAPEYLEFFPTSLTLCWQPAKSAFPVLGYEIEFRDLMQDATNWYRLTTDQLVTTCKTSIGSLLCGHQYQFRILAQNCIGLSNPSDPSPLITIGGGGERKETNKNEIKSIPLMEEIFVRESPPLPDRDDSPPPIYKQSESSLQWRDPTLKEVIDYLKSPDPNLVLDSSGYLQHLTFNNDLIKEETRNYGGIECLINILNSSNNPEILRNVCGSLKNLAFGKTNDVNKKLINQKNGLKSISQLLKTCKNSLVHEEATGALWNISSADELKEPILNQTAESVIKNAVIPSFELLYGQQQQNINNNNSSPSSTIQNNNNRNPIAIVFRNGTGILRNISAINDQSRRFLRSSPGLIEVLLNFLHFAVQNNQLDTRSAENVICLLRNLSYRIQEVVDNKYNPNRSKYQIKREELLENKLPLYSGRSKSAPSGSPKMTTNSKKGKQFFRRRKKSENELSLEAKEINLKSNGPQLLWHTSTIKLYLKILEESANCEILEATAAAIQNLAGCPFYGSLLVRETVRIEKGLPILVELLRLCEDRVVCAVCCALRNLVLDQRNLELIGRFALSDILIKIPNKQQFELIKEQQKIHLLSSDLTLNAILGILWEIVKYNSEMAKLVHQTIEGTERLRALAKCYPIYGRKTCKYATQVLYIMWQYKELHELFKESGLEESDFYSIGTLNNKGGKIINKEIINQKQQQQYLLNKHSPSSITTNTLARPFSSQGMEKPTQILNCDNSQIFINTITTTTTTNTTPLNSKSISSVSPYISSKQKPLQTLITNKQLPQQQFYNEQQQKNYFKQDSIDQLYSSVNKGNENTQKQRRQSIDSWV